MRGGLLVLLALWVVSCTSPTSPADIRTLILTLSARAFIELKRHHDGHRSKLGKTSECRAITYGILGGTPMNGAQ